MTAYKKKNNPALQQQVPDENPEEDEDAEEEEDEWTNIDLYVIVSFPLVPGRRSDVFSVISAVLIVLLYCFSVLNLPQISRNGVGALGAVII